MNILLKTLYDIGKIALNISYEIYKEIVYSAIDISFIFNNTASVDEVFICRSTAVKTIDNFAYTSMMNISWKIIEIITVINLCYTKTIIPYFNYITDDYYRRPILLIKDGNEIFSARMNDPISQDIKYDMILQTEYNKNNDSKKNYTIISYDIKNKNTIEQSNISFIIFQLTTNNEKYDINLKEPKNFLLKNNSLNYPFFKWYMKCVYNVDLTECFKINYMTQDMSLGELNYPFLLKINDDSITSFSYKSPEPIIKEEEEEEEEKEEEKEEEEEEEEDEEEEEEKEEEEDEEEEEDTVEENKIESSKLCENMDCERFPPDWDFDEDTESTYQEGQYKKCRLCEGYFDDDGMSDILFIEEEPNNQEGECDLCGKNKDIVQMKGSGQYLCGNACDEESDEESDKDRYDDDSNKESLETDNNIMLNDECGSNVINDIIKCEKLKQH